MCRCEWSPSIWAVPIILALGLSAAHAQSKIGIASTARNQVERITAGGSRALSSGGDVFLNERVRTGEESQAQLVFLDETNLGVGPKSEVKLDRFVYNPDRGTGRVVVNAGRGVFRFVTGSQDPKNYTVKTPIATIGVRGTDFHLLVERDRIVVALVTGALRIVTSQNRAVSLTQPGTALTVFADGRVVGPAPWSGPIVRYAGNVPFPYFGSEPTVTALPPVVPSPVVPIGGTNWTGIYVGATGGGGSTRSTNTYTTVPTAAVAAVVVAPPPFVTSDAVTLRNVSGGGEVGFNLQFANLVIGLASDLASGSQSASNALATCVAATASCGTTTFARAYTERIAWFGTTRGRAGVAFDRVFAYATGGVAYAEVKIDSATTIVVPGVAVPGVAFVPPAITLGTVNLSTSQTKAGWVAGAGFEVAVIGNLSFKVEYLHVDFGTLSSSATMAPTTLNTTVANRLAMESVRAGINFRF